MTDRSQGIPPEQLEDDDLRREMAHLHETRHMTVRNGSESALQVHTERMLALESEFLRRFPQESAPDPMRTRAGSREEAGQPPRPRPGRLPRLTRVSGTSRGRVGDFRRACRGLPEAYGVGMTAPQASRPFMPGYGILPADGGGGLLPWSWAVEQLATSRSYWLSSVGADGQPHTMPVWGVWLDGALWFSTGGRSRKARNLRHEPRCSLATEEPEQPVVLQGGVEIVRERALIVAFLDAANAKYDAAMDLDFLDPDVNLTVRVPPRTVLALREADFTGSPTRWRFG